MRHVQVRQEYVHVAGPYTGFREQFLSVCQQTDGVDTEWNILERHHLLDTAEVDGVHHRTSTEGIDVADACVLGDARQQRDIHPHDCIE
ncbi:hypothetical protein D3C86_1694200 [compost metagenome]